MKEDELGVVVVVLHSVGEYEEEEEERERLLLYYMMQRMGFCPKWIGWIKVYMESSTLSVLVNGSPTSEFKNQKGLRQGDPIAPFLFLLRMV